MFKAVFLRWWLIFTMIVVAFIISWNLGFMSEVYNNDSTPISVIIFSIFVVMSVLCGRETWKVNKLEGTNVSHANLIAMDKAVEIGKYVCASFLALGFIGTIWGIKEMSPQIANLDIANLDAQKSMLLGMASGMGVALYTTFVGLVCSLLLGIQYFNLRLTVDYLDAKEENQNQH